MAKSIADAAKENDAVELWRSFLSEEYEKIWAPKKAKAIQYLVGSKEANQNVLLLVYHLSKESRDGYTYSDIYEVMAEAKRRGAQFRKLTGACYLTVTSSNETDLFESIYPLIDPNVDSLYVLSVKAPYSASDYPKETRDFLSKHLG